VPVCLLALVLERDNQRTKAADLAPGAECAALSPVSCRKFDSRIYATALVLLALPALLLLLVAVLVLLVVGLLVAVLAVVAACLLLAALVLLAVVACLYRTVYPSLHLCAAVLLALVLPRASASLLERCSREPRATHA
jgi:hypothetical protein